MTEQEAPPPPAETPALTPHPESLSLTSTPTETAPVVSGIIAEPWLRFFARIVDIHIWSLVAAVIAGLLLPWLFADRSFLTGQLGSRLLGWILVPVALTLDAISYGLFGNTPGKWIAGIRVLSLAGAKVSFPTYLKRNAGLYWFGLGLEIPIVLLVTMWRSYDLVEGKGTVRWDESTGTRAFVRRTSTLRLVAIGVIWLLFLIWEIVALLPS